LPVPTSEGAQTPKGRFQFDDYVSDNGQLGFGLDHPRGLNLRPELPLSTNEVHEIDLTHIIHTHDVSNAKGGPGGGGGGTGGGLTFPNYTTAGTAGSVYNFTIEFKGSWSQGAPRHLRRRH
jgi:hypothetical protein